MSGLRYLWSCIARSSTAYKHIRLFILVFGEPEVDQHWLVNIIWDLSHHYIFGFYVPVHYTTVMQNTYSNAYLMKVSLKWLFWFKEFKVQKIEKVHTQPLHNDVYWVLIAIDTVVLADTCVTYTSRNCVLALNAFLFYHLFTLTFRPVIVKRSFLTHFITTSLLSLYRTAAYRAAVVE